MAAVARAIVTRAILLDPEARGARKTEARFGRLREPVLYMTAMLRALDGPTDGFIPVFEASQSAQQLFSPETVFNYYPAEFTPIGSSIPAAEEGQHTTSVMQPIFDNPASIVRLFFANLRSQIAKQLQSGALLVEGRALTGLKRQVVSALHGGFDTHDRRLSRIRCC